MVERRKLTSSGRKYRGRRKKRRPEVGDIVKHPIHGRCVVTKSNPDGTVNILRLNEPWQSAEWA